MENTRKIISNEEKLHRAVTNRSIVNILALLERNIDLESVDPNGNTVIHLVFRDCDSKNNITQQQIIQILKIFLDRGMNVNTENIGGFTALHLAVISRMKRVVKFLLDRKAHLHTRDAQGNTLLHYFVKSEMEQLEIVEVETDDTEIAKSESVEFLNWLVSIGFQLDCTNDSGLSPLHLSIQYNLQHIVPILLKHTHKLDLRANANRTLLHRFLEAHTRLKKPCMKFGEYSLFSCNTPLCTINIVKSLLVRGISVDVINDGDTVLHLAIKYKVGVEILELLAERFSAVHEADYDGQTAFDLAMDAWWRDSKLDDYLQIIQILVSKGSDLSRRNASGLTPVQQAVVRNNLQLLSILKKGGADLRVRTQKGESLLHLAGSDERMIKFLVESHVDVNGCDNQGISPLHAQVWHRCSAKVKSLLKYGANPDLLDSNGFNVLRKAICQRNLPMVKELLKYGVDVCDNEIIKHFQLIDNEVRDYLLKHIVMMSVARLPGIEYCERVLGPLTFGPFREECRREIVGLEKCFIDDRNTSLLDFLRMDPNRRCVYVKSGRLESMLNDPTYGKRFPNYFVLLLSVYLQTARRKCVLRLAERAWYDLTGIFLPHVCVDRILAHMSNVDLMLMIKKSQRKLKRTIKGSGRQVKRPKLTVYLV